MIQWLYRYVFRGLGIALLIGMITCLYLAFNDFRRSATRPPAPPLATHR